MIKEIKVYTICCDNCGKDALEDSEYCGFNSTDAICIDDWATEGDLHYCPNCFEYNESDELTLKQQQS